MKSRWFAALTGLILLAALLAAPQAALTGAQQGISLFTGTLLPSLFPFLVAGQLIAQSGSLVWAGQAMGRIMPRLFRLPGSAALALCISIASGYPAGARIVGDLTQAGQLSSRQARRAAQLASHGGPAFIVGTLGTAMLGDSRLGFLLWAGHVLASLLLNLVLARFRGPFCDKTALSSPSAVPPPSLSALLLGVGRTLVVVGGTVVLFSVILSLARSWGVLQALSDLLAPLLPTIGLDPQLAPALVSGLLEITAGCQSAAQSGAPVVQVIMVMAFLSAFGGISIQLQSLALLPGVSWGPFVLYKTTQALVSVGLTRALIAWFPLSVTVYLPFQQAQPQVTFGQLATLAGFALTVLLVFYFCVAILLHFADD